MIKLLSQNYWNPFRDWNNQILLYDLFVNNSLKTTETLLGIETPLATFLISDS